MKAAEKVVLYTSLSLKGHEEMMMGSEASHEKRGNVNSPNKQNKTKRRHLGKIKRPQRPIDLLLPKPPHNLSHSQRQQNTQTQLLQDIGVHGAQGTRIRRLPVGELGRLGDEAVNQTRRDEAAQHVADDDLDDGGGVVAARGAGHNDVGGDCRREAGGDDHAHDDGG